jgi:pSer/pThr/pTyr-binding forkhead associated (FHA) protein
MASELLSIRLTGIAGCSRGKEFSIAEGEQATVGRSRSCTFRLDAMPGPISEEDARKPFHGTAGMKEHLLTVSGQHVRIQFNGAKAIIIEDLSKHGTFLNGKRIEGRDQILGLHKGPMELKLGTNETFRVEFIRTPVKAPPKISVKRRA